MAYESSRKPVNVASVPKRSPFRYPGGKTWLVPMARAWLGSLSYRPACLYEPFAGGAIIGLTAAFEGLAEHVCLCELDAQVASVWKTILDPEGARWLTRRILAFSLSEASVRELMAADAPSTWELAFQTLVKNRTYHGGILAQGSAPSRRGENGKGIGSRWYPQTLAQRIADIAAVRHRISFLEGDGMGLVAEHLEEPDVAWFVDPPYSASRKGAGTRLYTHYTLDHASLFAMAARMAGALLMTYDNAREIREMAAANGLGFVPVPMSNRRNAVMTELLISSDLSWIRTPEQQPALFPMD